MNEQEKQQKYLEYQIISQQIEQMQQQFTQIQHQMMELVKVNDTLEELKKSDDQREILIPLGAGIFVNGNVSNPKNLITNIGMQTAVNKSVDEVNKLVKEQIQQLNEYTQQIKDEISKLALHQQNIVQYLQ